MRGPRTRTFCGRSRYSSTRMRTVESVAVTASTEPQPASRGTTRSGARRRMVGRAYASPLHGPPSHRRPRPRRPAGRPGPRRMRRAEGLGPRERGPGRPRRRRAVLLALLGLPHPQRRRRAGLGDPGARPRARRRPELQPAQGDLRPGPLRDPQRRLLGRDHAREHRDRRPGAGHRALPGEVLGQGREGADRAEAHRLLRPVVLDRNRLRNEPDAVRAALARRGPGFGEALDRVLGLDARRRELLPELEELRAEKNKAGEAIAAAKRAGEDAAGAIAAMQKVGSREKALNAELAEVEAELRHAETALPNLPDPDAADADTTLREVGDATRTGKDHLELAGARIDMEAGARVAGSRFAVLRGDLVMLELALMRWALERVRAHGHEPALPPVLAREEALFGTGFLPDTEQQIYRLADDPLYLVGTSEVPLASLHAGDILDEEALPLRYAAFSPCFRREAGAAGKDTRGIFRVHQSNKVEMFSFVAPSKSAEEHERLLSIEEELLQELGLPYRVVNIAIDDLGASAAKKYDCEAWLPGQGQYRELTSTSNTTDYQARRLEIRMRPSAGGRPVVLHTLNGTAVTDRWVIALLENGQREDGGVDIPPVLAEFGAPRSLSPA